MEVYSTIENCSSMKVKAITQDLSHSPGWIECDLENSVRITKESPD